ncbi:glycerol-3-phosphate 1-O-acyltransferase PlsY [Spiroplasma alleghenense]|uniref:Glycerol-3-phosphate acyltransferase n=1 Tax=Spiroplasma alleghenense TaxID=216931 RepID=A0A345Z3K4_9MOLU|nr:glycerol-3-phosphate 1-O-acyltransferase PlsY [Spiroplasma alleghenense]AXK51183.1 glycerol-3-phosphate acyltransferase PlsY [Spiroplasma alleghenense]
MILGTLFASIIGYLIGSISFSIVFVRFKTGGDVRKHGSNNAGATNASRILGKKWGLFIVFLDLVKVVVASFVALGISAIPHSLFSETSLFIPALFALIGHCYPVYYKFKGGKAVSCFIGLILVANGFYAVIFTIIWWTTIFVFRKISISSLAATIGVLILAWVPQISSLSNFSINGSDFNQIYFQDDFVSRQTWMNFFHSFVGQDGDYFFESWLVINITVTIGGIILIIKHHANIKRLFQGTEPYYFTYGQKTKRIDVTKESDQLVEKESVVKELKSKITKKGNSSE